MRDPWPIVRLAEIADIGTGVTLGRDLGDSYSVEYPYLRVANVQDGRIDTSDVKNIRIFPSELTRYRLQAGDILLTEGGDFDKLGRGAVWDGRIPSCLHQNHIFRVRLRSDFSPQFFSAYMRSAAGRAYFLSCAKQTTNLASINKTQLSAMPVPAPPPSEQQRIAEILDSADDQIQVSLRLFAKQEETLKSLEFVAVRDSISSPPMTVGEIIRNTPGGLIQTGPFGSQLHAYEYTESGVPVVMPQDMIGQSITEEKIVRIRESKAQVLSRHRMIPGDVVFGRRGDLSRCAVVAPEQEGWLCGTGCLLARLPSRAISR